MIIEQIRYYVKPEDRQAVLEARREVSRLRDQSGVPAGHILVADMESEDGPVLVWQCGYEDEGALGMAEAALLGNADYEEARQRLGNLVSRVELELYMSDEE